MMGLSGCQERSAKDQIVSICKIIENATKFDRKKVMFSATAIRHNWYSLALADKKCATGPSTLALILNNETDRALLSQSEDLSDSNLLMGVFGEFVGTIVIPETSGLHMPSVAMEVELIKNPTFQPATNQYESLLEEPPPPFK